MPRTSSIAVSTLRTLTHSPVVRAIAASVAITCGALGGATYAATQTHASAMSPGPKIYSVSALPHVAHAGDRVKWDAHVSPDVVSVTARVAVYTFSLYPVRSGHFGETFSIPKDVPPFFHGNYSVTITATAASGATAQRSIALIFQ